MACTLEIKDEIARVRMRLLDTPRDFDDVVLEGEGPVSPGEAARHVGGEAGPGAGAPAQVATPTAEATQEHRPRARALAPLIGELQTELKAEAERALGPDVEVSLLVTRGGSLEVAAILTVGKLVIDAGAFLGGLREIRSVFPKRVRDVVSRWLGRDIAAEPAIVTVSDGTLLGSFTKTVDKAADGVDAKASRSELGWYALLATAVLVGTLVFIVGGVLLMT